MNALLTLLEPLKLSTKLVLGFSVGILTALTLGIYGLNNLQTMEQRMETMYEMDLLGVSYIREANLNLIYMSRAMRHMLIAQDDATRDTALATIKRSREKLNESLLEARKRMFRPEVIERYEIFQRDLTKALEGIEHAVAMIQRERLYSSAAAAYITSSDFGATIARVDGGLHELTDLKEAAAAATLAENRLRAERTRSMTVTMLFVGIALSVLLGMVIGASIRRPSESLSRAVGQLAEGNVDAPIPHTDYPNEIGAMARAVHVLQGIYRQSNDQHWVKSHVAGISSALQQAEDFRALAQATVSKAAPAMNAGHGAFYVLDAEGTLSLLASYGYRERKGLSNSFRMGEGLVGQCAMEKSTILLTAPKDYIRIGSGLGEGPPSCIMVLPVMRGDRVLGVLEMAAFHPFTERERSVLDNLLPALASSLEILDRNLKTRELLTATQEQAERMEKQAAQLEEQTVEMEAQQAELLETENWFRGIIENAPDGMLVVDAKGRILLSNPMAEQLFGYGPSEMIDGNIEALVPAAARASHGAQRAAFMAEGRNRVMGSGPQVKGLRKDGSEFPISVSLSTLPPRGERGRCVSVAVRALA